MNNIIKTILGLNIAIASVGIFFGVTKSGKVDEMRQAKISSEGKAQLASAEAKKLKKQKEEALAASSTKDGTIIGLKTQLIALQDGAVRVKVQINQANASVAAAQTTAAKVESDLQAVQQIANQVPGLQGQISSYENLGTPQEIKIKLDEFKTQTAKATPPPKGKKPKKTNTGEIGIIAARDARYGFYVINVGSDHGISKDDVFTVFRAGKAIGKIEVSRANRLASVAIYQMGFPKPSEPFVVGDKLYQFK